MGSETKGGDAPAALVAQGSEQRAMFAVIVAAMLVVLLAGCGSSSPVTQAEITTCGVPYVFDVDGHMTDSGDCAGLVLAAAPVVTLHVGDRLTVTIEHESSGRPVLPVPQPNTAAVVLLKSTGSGAVYRALAPGTSTLEVRTTFCVATDPRRGTCPALQVRIER